MNLPGNVGQLLAALLAQQRMQAMLGQGTQQPALGLPPRTFGGAFIGTTVRAALETVVTNMNLILAQLQMLQGRRIGNFLILTNTPETMAALDRIRQLVIQSRQNLSSLANETLGFVVDQRAPNSPEARFRNVVLQLQSGVNLGPLANVIEQLAARGTILVPVSTIAGFRNQIQQNLATLGSLIAAV